MRTRSCNVVRATLVACGTIGLLASLASAQSDRMSKAEQNKLDQLKVQQGSTKANPDKSLNNLFRVPSATRPDGLVNPYTPVQHSAGGIVRGPSAAVDDCNLAPTIAEGTHAFDTTTFTNSGENCVGAAVDGWWNFVPTMSGIATATTCGLSGSDTTLSAWGDCSGAALIVCNDDSCGLQSTITFPVTAGNSYKVRIAGFSSGTVTGSVSLSVGPPADCYVCPPGGIQENEFDCGLPVDSTNAGCSGAPPTYTTLSIGGTVCGTVAYDGFTRDLDWFRFTTVEDLEVTLTVTAEFESVIGFYGECPGSGFIDPFAVPGVCTSTGVVTACLPAGTYTAIVAPLFTSTIACGGPGSRYTASLTGTPCVAFVPPNDLCANAEALTLGSPVAGDNTNAQTNTILSDICGPVVGSGGSADVFYVFTAGVAETYRFDTCGSGIDTVIAVFGGCPAEEFSNFIACNDDFCGLASSVDVAMAASQTVYVRVASYTGGPTGAFQVVVNIAPPPATNENCPGDPLGAAPLTVFADNTGAASDVVVDGGCSFAGFPTTNDLFWTFTATADGLHTFDTCGSGLDTNISVFSACPADQTLNLLACNDDFCGLQSSVTVGLTTGQLVHVRVAGWNGSQGPFQLNVGAPFPARPDDECSGTLPVLTAGTLHTGDNFGATDSTTGLVDGDCGAFIGSAGGSDVWATFTPASTSNFLFDMCGSNSDTVLTIFSGCPAVAGTNLVACMDDATPNCTVGNIFGSRIDSATLTGGVTYFVRIGGYGGGTGDYQLLITELAPPTGACCNGGACTVVNEADCMSGGGTWQGVNAPCDSAGVENTYTSNPNLFIPDASCPGGVTDTIAVGDSYTISAIGVRVEIPAHTWIADLEISISNGVNTVIIWDAQCGGNNGLTVTFRDGAGVVVCAQPTTGTYNPLNPLAPFIGQNVAGNWALSVCDGVGADTGTLTTWSLITNEPAGGNVCGPAFCDADWCQDGIVGVPDIFCFLADWFANDPIARNYGGTNGVPAIFAFLSVWFAEGTGPCP